MDKMKADTLKTAKLSLEFAALWFLSNFFYNKGLSSTSVTSSTVLQNSSSIFVYIFSLWFLKDVHFDITKALMVVLSFSGIIVVTISDK